MTQTRAKKSKRTILAVVIGAVVLCALLIGADFAAKHYAEAELGRRFAKAFAASSPEATIDASPFLPGLLSSGSLGNVGVRARDANIAGVKLARVAIDLRGVVLDDASLFDLAKAKPKRVDKSTLTVDVAASEIARLTGAEVAVRDGAVTLSKFGFSVQATPKASGGRLVLSAPPLPEVDVPLPKNLFECDKLAASVEIGVVRIRCERDQPPAQIFGGFAK